jgi:hypothetical protein
MCDGIDAAISGKAIADIALFSGTARAAGCWLTTANASNLACIPSSSGRNGVLVTSKHAIFAAHYSPTVGDAMVFRDADGVAESVTVAAVSAHPTTDILLARLSSALSASIPPACVLPTDYVDYLGTTGSNIACVMADKDHNIGVGETSSLNTGGAAGWHSPANATRAAMHHPLATGDSGSPIMLLSGSNLCLLAVATGTGTGYAITGVRSWIESTIAAWGDTQTLTDLDLTSFTNFG